MENLPAGAAARSAPIAAAACEAILELYLDYAKEREAFGKPIGTFQHNRFLLAEMATEVAHRPGLRRRLRPGCTTRAKLDASAGRDGQVVDHRAAERSSSTGPCSCTAATAT